MISLADILTHTPVAVWAGLAALVLLGLRQTRTQAMSATRVWLVPARVALAIQPSRAYDPAAAAAAAIAYGFTTGLLAARSRKIWATRRDRGTPLAA